MLYWRSLGIEKTVKLLSCVVRYKAVLVLLHIIKTDLVKLPVMHVINWSKYITYFVFTITLAAELPYLIQ